MSTISGTVYDSMGALAVGRTVRAYRRDTGALLGSRLTGPDNAVVGDPYWSDVVLQLHMDGADGSTAFVDRSATPKTVTANGGAVVSTAQSKFGGASLALDGSGDYLSAPASTAYVFGTGDFTVELWIKTTTTAEKALVDQYSSSAASWQLFVKGGVLSWYQRDSSLVGSYLLTGTTVVNDGNWHHVAASRASGTLRFFVDGVLGGAASATTNYATSLLLGIGAQIATRNAAYDFPGYIDDLRITKGVARYTANFSPPSAPFPDGPGDAATPTGTYVIDTGGYAGECNVIALDDAAGTTYNDLILRTTPV